MGMGAMGKEKMLTAMERKKLNESRQRREDESIRITMEGG